jgi:L-iditol 2-dehydrogenase
VVIGAGPVGILAADSARALGASKVVFAARGARLAVVEKMGFESVDTEESDVVEAVRAVTTHGGASVVLDAAGTPEAIRLGLSLLARGGRCATVGIPTEDVQLDVSKLVLDELELVGVRASAGEMSPVLELMADGRVRGNELITHRYPLEDFATAMDVASRRVDGAIKVMIDMSLG